MIPCLNASSVTENIPHKTLTIARQVVVVELAMIGMRHRKFSGDCFWREVQPYVTPHKVVLARDDTTLDKPHAYVM